MMPAIMREASIALFTPVVGPRQSGEIKVTTGTRIEMLLLNLID